MKFSTAALFALSTISAAGAADTSAFVHKLSEALGERKESRKLQGDCIPFPSCSVDVCGCVPTEEGTASANATLADGSGYGSGPVSPDKLEANAERILWSLVKDYCKKKEFEFYPEPKRIIKGPSHGYDDGYDRKLYDSYGHKIKPTCPVFDDDCGCTYDLNLLVYYPQGIKVILPDIYAQAVMADPCKLEELEDLLTGGFNGNDPNDVEDALELFRGFFTTTQNYVTDIDVGPIDASFYLENGSIDKVGCYSLQTQLGGAQLPEPFPRPIWSRKSDGIIVGGFTGENAPVGTSISSGYNALLRTGLGGRSRISIFLQYTYMCKDEYDSCADLLSELTYKTPKESGSKKGGKKGESGGKKGESDGKKGESGGKKGSKKAEASKYGDDDDDSDYHHEEDDY